MSPLPYAEIRCNDPAAAARINALRAEMDAAGDAAWQSLGLGRASAKWTSAWDRLATTSPVITGNPRVSPVSGPEILPVSRLNEVRRPNARETMASIAYRVAKKHGLTVEDLKGKNSGLRYSWPRQEAMARMLASGFSANQIARYLRRHYSTVLTGAQRHAEREARA